MSKDIWQQAPQHKQRSTKPFNWFSFILLAGVIFLVARLLITYVLTGVFLSWHALLLLIFFALLPCVILLLKGNKGWDTLVDKFFVAFCVYLFLSLVALIATLLA